MNKKKWSLGGLMILVLSVISYLFLSLNCKDPSLTIGIIDINRIVVEQAKKITNNQTGHSATNLQLRQITDQLKEHIDQWAQDNHVILLSKNVVWGGDVIDYTPIILNQLGLVGEEE